MRGRHTGRAHEDAFRNAHARNLRRARKAAIHLPVRQKTRIEDFPQKTGARADHGPAMALRGQLDELHFKHVARLRALYEDRPGERMPGLLVVAGQVVEAHAGLDLPVGGISGFEQNILARGDLDDRFDIGMPAVMAGARVVAQAPVAIDANGFHQNTITESPPGQTARPLRHNRGLAGKA